MSTISRDFSISLRNIIEDFDGDGVEDFYDLDDDNDGFPDGYEIQYGSNPTDANSMANLAPNLLKLNGQVIEWNATAGTPVGKFMVNDPDTHTTLSLKLSNQ